MMFPSKTSFNTLFDEIFNDPFFSRRENNFMKTDVKEQNGNYLIDIELPGFEKEDIKAELKDGCLTITASRSESKEDSDKDGNYIRKERYSGTCSRSFYVGENVKEEDIKASYKNGILCLSVPKDTQPKIEEKKLITIE